MPATSPRRRPRRSVDFADLLHRERRRSGLTQQELADAIGANRSTIIRWESGDTNHLADPAMLRAACDTLDIRYTDALIALGAITAEDLRPVAA